MVHQPIPEQAIKYGVIDSYIKLHLHPKMNYDELFLIRLVTISHVFIFLYLFPCLSFSLFFQIFVKFSNISLLMKFSRNFNCLFLIVFVCFQCSEISLRTCTQIIFSARQDIHCISSHNFYFVTSFFSSTSSSSSFSCSSSSSFHHINCLQFCPLDKLDWFFFSQNCVELCLIFLVIIKVSQA